MATRKFFVFNSFSTSAFGGNPAGVLLDSTGLAQAQMQQIARQLNLVETAFVFSSPESGVAYDLRYFTPTNELPITGHPTIAAWSALIHTGAVPAEFGNYVQKTRAGNIRVAVRGGLVFASQKPATVRVLDALPDRLASTFNLCENDIDGRFPIAVVDAGLGHLIFAVRSLAALSAIRFDPQQLGDLCRFVGARECQVFSLEAEDPGSTAHTRNLCPRLGLEDPACGNGNAALGAYYWQFVNPGCHPRELLFEQGHIIGMPSLIRVIRDREGELMIGGPARLMVEGLLHI